MDWELELSGQYRCYTGLGMYAWCKCTNTDMHSQPSINLLRRPLTKLNVCTKSACALQWCGVIMNALDEMLMCKVASLKYNQARLYTYYKCKRRLINESEASIPNLVAIGQYRFITGLVLYNTLIWSVKYLAILNIAIV